jgi:hypothetical protein
MMTRSDVVTMTGTSCVHQPFSIIVLRFSIILCKVFLFSKELVEFFQIKIIRQKAIIFNAQIG